MESVGSVKYIVATYSSCTEYTYRIYIDRSLKSCQSLKKYYNVSAVIINFKISRVSIKSSESLR